MRAPLVSCDAVAIESELMNASHWICDGQETAMYDGCALVEVASGFGSANVVCGSCAWVTVSGEQQESGFFGGLYDDLCLDHAIGSAHCWCCVSCVAENVTGFERVSDGGAMGRMVCRCPNVDDLCESRHRHADVLVVILSHEVAGGRNLDHSCHLYLCRAHCAHDL